MLSKNLVSELSEEQLDELLAYTPDFTEKNLENIKMLSLKKLDSPEIPRRRTLSMRKVIAMAAAAIIILATSTGIFAASGGLEHFLARFNPSFGEFAIAPLYPAYAEDQGIRIEAVGAQHIGPVVLVYVIMQDISGENRLTRHMIPAIDIYVDGQIINGPSTSSPLNFDSSTNTVYFEMRIHDETGMPRADTLDLIINEIWCLEHTGRIQTPFTGEWQITVNTSDLGIQPITWTDVEAGNLSIEHISVNPFGVHVVGTHTYGTRPRGSDPVLSEVSIEFDNRWFNTRLVNGGLFGYDNRFYVFFFANSPIDIDAVSAVIVRGERFQVP